MSDKNWNSLLFFIVFTIIFCVYKVRGETLILIVSIILILMLSIAFEFIWLKKFKNKPFALTFLFLLFMLPCKYVEVSVYYLMSSFKSNLIAYLYEFPSTYALLIIPFVDIIVGIRHVNME
jgi:hypothetical protein